LGGVLGDAELLRSSPDRVVPSSAGSSSSSAVARSSGRTLSGVLGAPATATASPIVDVVAVAVDEGRTSEDMPLGEDLDFCMDARPRESTVDAP
jgi:hypothetical protein